VVIQEVVTQRGKAEEKGEEEEDYPTRKHMIPLLTSFTKLEYYSKFGKTTKEHTPGR